MIVVGGGTSAATPLAGVEDLLSALPLFSPAEWLWLIAFLALPGMLAGAWAATARLRRPREEMVARKIREASEARGGGAR